MKPMRKSVVQLIVATGITLSSAIVYGQPVVTPYPSHENGPALTQEEEASRQNNMGPGMIGGQAEGVGGTVAPELGGTLGGSGMDRLPETPGPAPEDLTGVTD